ncbi:hypothetical protein AB0F52_46065 [Amycolatopsis sp. NPDC024027]|uniref:hypothetical protein n=1 Tax=Amycolatopsis sp. NPDC024027 TaxID=3154327 RepID=UPI0033CA22DF
MTPAELRRLARNLELEICVGRLVARVLPQSGTPGPPEQPGRLRVLEDVVEKSPALFEALLDENADAIELGWTRCLGAHGDDPHFLHAIAVLSRERALATDDPSGGPLVFATALWALLLGSDQFWAEFGEPDTGVRSTLLDTVFRELCALHVTLGGRALAAGAADTARPHIAILTDCQEGTAALVRFVREFGLRYRLTTGEPLMTRVSAIARDALGGWCADLIRVATDAANDPDAIAKLPAGIKQDYSSGLAVLSPFVGAGVPVAPVLSFGLDWYSKWFFDLYARNDEAELRERLASAGEWADRLVPLCDKGLGHLPGNKALSAYFMFRGYTADDAGLQITEYEESLAWNPANGNARELLLQARTRPHVRQAEILYADDRYAEALKAVKKALTITPGREDLVKFERHVTELVSEEANLRFLRKATDALVAGDFAGALHAAAKVDAGSPFAETARKIQATTLFRRAAEPFKNDRSDSKPEERW